jgi:hypothetical protein
LNTIFNFTLLRYERANNTRHFVKDVGWENDATIVNIKKYIKHVPEPFTIWLKRRLMQVYFRGWDGLLMFFIYSPSFTSSSTFDDKFFYCMLIIIYTNIIQHRTQFFILRKLNVIGRVIWGVSHLLFYEIFLSTHSQKPGRRRIWMFFQWIVEGVELNSRLYINALKSV